MFLLKLIRFTQEQTTKGQKESTVIVVLFPRHQLQIGLAFNTTPEPLLFRDSSDTPCIGGTLGHRNCLEGAETSPLPRFERWTVQLVASRYTV